MSRMRPGPKLGRISEAAAALFAGRGWGMLVALAEAG
jgi:hypothetical protein